MLRNFFKSIERLLIISEANKFGYRFATFDSNFSDTIQGRPRRRTQQLVAAFRSMHEYIEIFLKIFAEKSSCGHKCESERRTRLLLHFALIFYFFIVPKTEDVSAIKGGDQTK